VRRARQGRDVRPCCGADGNAISGIRMNLRLVASGRPDAVIGTMCGSRSWGSGPGWVEVREVASANAVGGDEPRGSARPPRRTRVAVTGEFDRAVPNGPAGAGRRPGRPAGPQVRGVPGPGDVRRRGYTPERNGAVLGPGRDRGRDGRPVSDVPAGPAAADAPFGTRPPSPGPAERRQQAEAGQTRPGRAGWFPQDRARCAARAPTAG